jgi:hypothetical protein
MNTDYGKYLRLINCSLNQEKFVEEITWENAKTIRANQLVGLTYKTMETSLISEEALKLLKNDYYQYVRTDELQKQMIKELKSLFTKEKIDFIFLKGTFIKELYPESYMRAMGDIDVLVKDYDMERIHQVLESNGFNNWTNSTSHDCFIKDRINVEIHPMLDSDIEGEYKKLFLDPWHYTVKISESEYLLAREYNFFYQLYHMIKHLYRSGVGFRTIVDLGLLLKKEGHLFEQEKFFAIYEEFPKKDFVRNIIEVINDSFNTEYFKDYGLIGTMTKLELNEFIEFLFFSGTHGYGEDYNIFIGDMAKKNRKRNNVLFTKIKFLLSRTFLPYKQMKGMYRYLSKCPMLLPIAWGQRLCKLLFKKSSRDKLKNLQVDKAEILRVEKMFENLGI